MENAKMKLLKEMKAENILPPEALDEASAGSCYEMAEDSRFLNVLLRGDSFQPDRYGATKCWINSDSKISLELSKAWAAVCIDFRPRDTMREQNAYFKQGTGEALTREQAMAYAQEAMGVTLKRSDWDW